ncbi:Caudovirales tail fiber assembly protein, lambda gpK [compost metagenome]
MQYATTRVATLQDAVDLGIATEKEVAALQEWTQYRLAIYRLDMAVSPVAWPEIPMA